MRLQSTLLLRFSSLYTANRISLEHHHHTRKRRTSLILTVNSEMQPTFNEPDFCFMVDILMESLCISSCRNEHNDFRVSAFFSTFLDPLSKLSAVWGIAKHGLPPPILRKSVIFFCVKLCTFRCFRFGTRIKRKMELFVKFREKVRRRFPVVPIRR